MKPSGVVRVHLAHSGSVSIFNNHIIIYLILTYNFSYFSSQILFYIIFCNPPCHLLIKEKGSLKSLNKCSVVQ